MKDCWNNPKNAGKQPKWFKPKTDEVTAAGVGSGEKTVKLMLMAMKEEDELKFLSDLHLLLDPNIWVADSAMTVHNMPHKQGFTNVCDVSKGKLIMMGNGDAKLTATVGDLHGIICNK